MIRRSSFLEKVFGFMGWGKGMMAAVLLLRWAHRRRGAARLAAAKSDLYVDPRHERLLAERRRAAERRAIAISVDPLAPRQ
jgi:hypothetical protein